MAKRIYNEQINFNIVNKNTIEMKTENILQEEIKPKIEMILKNKANVYYLKNAFNVFLLFTLCYVTISDLVFRVQHYIDGANIDIIS